MKEMMTIDTSKKTMLQRIWGTLSPSEMPSDDRGRMRMVVDNLVLHLHPTKVPIQTLRWTYTWGLGGLSGLLFIILIFTGIFLEMNYTPSPEQAYLDIISLRTNVWFGDLLRNIHHWSANFLVVTVFLHLLRVFYTGAHRAPRETNWLVGVLMLLLVLASNFTGYLLPWDQLAYWAITVGTGILAYIPLIGNTLSQFVLGGPEVSGATLLNFYALHISFIPVATVLLMSLHFWRVRKDGGLSLPKSPAEAESQPVQRVTTIPHLVRRELVWAVIWIAVLIAWSVFIPAPLEGIANPEVSPNPAKAPWYFMGLQELLLHFHPMIGAILIPGVALSALALLPFFDIQIENIGVYFRSYRGRFLTLLAFGLAGFLVPAWVVVDEFILDWTTWLPGWPSLISNGLVPLAVVILFLYVIDEGLQRFFKANIEERALFLFSFLLAALLILTLVGIFFRGPGMNLYWPWDIPLLHG